MSKSYSKGSMGYFFNWSDHQDNVVVIFLFFWLMTILFGGVGDMESSLLNDLGKTVGDENVLTTREDLLAYGAGSGFSHGAEAVVLPRNTDEISKVLMICNGAKVPVYPSGVGAGGTVSATGGVVLSTARLNRIIEIDTANLIAVVEPGVAVDELNKALAADGLMFPPDPGTAGATLGDTVSGNATGLRGPKYGVSKHYIMGLEVVLADGRVLRTGGKTVKDVAGYDLTKLFTGSAGTLGVITRLTVKLVPAPEAIKCLLATFAGSDDAGRTIAAITAAGIMPAALEIMDRVTLRAAADYARVDLPADAEALLLIELDGIEEVVEREAAKAAALLQANKAGEVRTAGSSDEREAIWAIRRAALPALAKLGPMVLISDYAVPRSQVSTMVRAVNEIAARHMVTIGTFGHAGEGVVHAAMVGDSGDEAEKAQLEKAMDEVFAAARRLGGTLAGEGGGRGMRKFADDRFGPAGLAAMLAIKKALDPNCILSPGKLGGEC